LDAYIQSSEKSSSEEKQYHPQRKTGRVLGFQGPHLYIRKVII
jgi:hypothetical protein